MRFRGILPQILFKASSAFTVPVLLLCLTFCAGWAQTTPPPDDDELTSDSVGARSQASSLSQSSNRGLGVVPQGKYNLYGLNFSPYLNGQDPAVNPVVTPEQIRSRLQPIAAYTTWIHTFSMTTGNENIPPIAKSMGLKVAAGAWISANFAQNDTEIMNLVAAANAGNVDIAVVGSEVLRRGDVSISQLVAYMNQVRNAIPANIPVTTSEVYSVLFAPSAQPVRDASDVLFANFYPYWETRPIEHAVCFLATAYNQALTIANGKPIVIAESGWPSGGGKNYGAVASPVNGGQFFLQFISWARSNNLPYFYFSAYDEAWKFRDEGGPGPYWGIWDQYGLMKPLMQPVFNGTTVPVDCTPGGPGTPQLKFDYVPPYGDSDVFPLEGTALHVLPWNYAVVVYIKVRNGWWIKPYQNAPVTALQGDGTWMAHIHTGGLDSQAATIAAFLIPITYSPPILLGAPSLPQALYDNSVANLAVPRSVNSISGQVLGTGNTVTGATITLSGVESQVTASGRLFGEYSFYNLAATGPYTVVGSGLGLNYDPPQTFASVTGLLRAVWIHASSIPEDLPGVRVEHPGNGETVAGTIVLKGWAIDNLTSAGSNLGGIDVRIDGNSMGNATYGWFRPDVCAVYPARPDCPNVGFAYWVDTSKLARGPHKLEVCASDTDLLQTDTGCRSVSVSVNSPPSVHIERPLDGSTVSGTITVKGWAINNTSTIGTAIKSVQVQVDGVTVANATYGLSRPDVCAAFPGRLGCPNVGFSYQLNTTAFTLGRHTVMVCAMDSDPTPGTGCQSIVITVAVAPPSVYIERPANGSTVSGTITVKGWAINNTSTIGSAIGSVQVQVDGVTVGSATYGLSRPDVCAAYPGRLGCPNVGYSYQLNTTGFTQGPHTITVCATDTDPTPVTGCLSVAITVAVALPSVYIERPLNGSTVSGTTTVKGWALDNASTIGTAVGPVLVQVDGATVGHATYGLARSDVCAVYPGRPGCPNVGYSYQLNTTGFTQGPHTITVCAADTDATPDTGCQTEAITVGPSLLSRYNLAPSSRTVRAVSIYATNGNVQNPSNLLSGNPTRLTGSGSYVTVDFGKEVGGIATLHFAGASDTNQIVGLAFSESSLFVGPESDASNSNGADGAIYAPVAGSGVYTMPTDKLRGGFRYLTIFMASAGWAEISDLSLQFTASPAMADLRAYPNYFLSNDDLLNRIWYAGAYTVQMDTIDPAQGRVWPLPPSGWENNGVVGSSTTVLTDGAKRDRTVWPGDLGISAETAFVSTGDTASTRNSLTTLYQHQGPDGGFPYCGPEVNEGTISDTYHLWTLVGTAEYVFSSSDTGWLTSHWNQYKAGVGYSTRKIDGNGLMNVDRGGDWGRDGNLGATLGEEIEANALLYQVLVTGANLARIVGDLATASTYDSLAINLKQGANAVLWDTAALQYRDTPGSTLHPQDGNSLALWFGLVDSSSKATNVSQALHQNWNQFGALTPEKANGIATFPGSMEVQAHFAAGDDQAGLDLIRLEWGYMLNNATSTMSTFWEGYMADGTFLVFDFPYGLRGQLMSHAHGWATGPTSALTFYVLGLGQDASGGSTYQMVPHPGDLTHAEGQLALPFGPVAAWWTRDQARGTFIESVQTSDNVYGRIGVPTFGRDITVYVDGSMVWNSCNPATNNNARRGLFDSGSDNAYFYLDGMRGGHIVTSMAISCAGGSIT